MGGLLLSEKVRSGDRAFSLGYSVVGTTDLYRRQEAYHSADTSFDVLGSYRILPVLNVGLALGAGREVSGEKRWLLSDGAVKIGGRVAELGEWTVAQVSVQALLPFSQESGEVRSTRTTLTVTPSVTQDLESVGLKHVALTFSLGFSRALHQYETSATGASNKVWGVNERLGLEWKVTKRVSLSAFIAQGNAWTYEGNLTQSLSSGQELDIILERKTNLALMVGHRLGGDQLKPNGQDTSIELFNSNASVLFLGLAQTF